MEAENQLYAEKQGDRQGQPPPAEPLQYTPTPEQQQQPDQFQGCTLYGQSTTAAASPYYAAPSGAEYAGGYGVPPASQQQQQVTIVTVNQAPTVYVKHCLESYTGALIYSCIVMWGFNLIFGCSAFVLAGAYATVNSRVERRYCVTCNSSRFRGLPMEIRGVSVGGVLIVAPCTIRTVLFRFVFVFFVFFFVCRFCLITLIIYHGTSGSAARHPSLRRLSRAFSMRRQRGRACARLRTARVLTRCCAAANGSVTVAMVGGVAQW